MAKNTDKINEIATQLASGTITTEDAVAGLIEAGMSEEDARYNVKSMETIDVR